MSHSRSKPRLLHLIGHPVQYYVPLYRHLAACDSLDLTVCFHSDWGVRDVADPGFGRIVNWDVPLLTGYQYWFLRDHERANSSAGLAPLQTLEVARAVVEGRFDVVWIHGYSSINVWLLTLTCRALGIPVLLRDDATLLGGRSRAKELLKALVLPTLFRLVGGLYVGAENRRFFEHYGIGADRLFFTPHSVDNDFFRREANCLAGDRRTIRRSLDLHPDYPVILFCGKLIPTKDPLTLLSAFRIVRKSVPCSLLFAGDGALHEAIVELVNGHHIPDVRIAGFLNQSRVSRAYAVADLIVLPSQGETWGLVVNEAMNFGLAVVVSDKVGCSADLVAPGVNGLVVPAGSVADLAEALQSLVSDPGKCKAFGETSRQIVDKYDVRRTADGIVEAVRAVTSER